MKNKWSSKKKAVMKLIKYYEFNGDTESIERLKLRYADVLK